MTTVVAGLFDLSVPPASPGGDGMSGQPAGDMFGALLDAAVPLGGATVATHSAVIVRPAPPPSGEMVLTLAQPAPPSEVAGLVAPSATPLLEANAPLPDAPTPSTAADLPPPPPTTPPPLAIRTVPTPPPAATAPPGAIPQAPAPRPIAAQTPGTLGRPIAAEVKLEAESDEEADAPPEGKDASTPPLTTVAVAAPQPVPALALAPVKTAVPPADEPRVAAAGDQPRNAPSGTDPEPVPAHGGGAPDRSAPATAAADTGPAFVVPAGAAPVPTAATAATAAATAVVTAQPGRMGRELGVAIARHVAAGGATGGGETITLRLNPVDMGRIEVKLSFDDGGTLRAVVSADNPAALDMLRRDSADLGRALVDAGVRADTQTLRFDTRTGADQGGGQRDGGQPWRRHQDARTDTPGTTPEPGDALTARYRPLRTSSRIDLVA